VIGTANTAQKAVLQVLEKKPDVILLDIVWFNNKEEGLNAIRQIKEVAPETGILAMTAYDEMLEPAFLAGADRVIHKDYLNTKDALVEHIQASYENHLLPKINADRAGVDKLSPREQEVLELMCEGLANGEIAKALCLEETTVKKHAAHVYAKLNVKRRTEAVAYAIQHGLSSRKKDRNHEAGRDRSG
jgi:DNA-binding NarL/FixJ family response regulator